jgi:hypothetical protein
MKSFALDLALALALGLGLCALILHGLDALFY